MEIKKYIQRKRELVDNFLTRYFKNDFDPPVLKDAMLYSLFAGGKRIRPILAISSYEACGGKSADIIPYASAIELIHTYSLIHDDLPAMDNDDLRRGKPTNHKVYGEATAILAGDALLTEAFAILSDTSLSPAVPAAYLLKAIREIAAASGLKGMVAGQVQDMLSEKKEPDETTLKFIHSHKTGALMLASVRLGPILYGSDKKTLECLTVYGRCIGHAFQIIDDILDVVGSTEELGKTAGADEKINKMTYPRLFGLDRSMEIADNLINEAKTAIANMSESADPLREIADYLLKRRN